MARLTNQLVVAAVALFGLCSSVLAQGTLQTIKARGHIRCGASQGVAGFSLQDAQGYWVGFDVDVCRALAAAIFNDPGKAQFLPLSSKDRITALQSGEVDVLSRTMTWTLARDSAQGLIFTAVNYYDGQGFKVRKSLKVGSLKELQGASICVAQGTTNELNVADYFRANNMKYEVVTFADIDDVVQAYQNGRCDALSTDVSQLASYRLKMTNPDEHVVLPEVISKEPIGPWVRQGDVQWFHIVRWTLFAMLNAEELGVTQANVDRDADFTEPRGATPTGLGGQPRGWTRPHKRLGSADRASCRKLR
jgi:general L-amino acid transport system substrate-binding protein